MMRAWLGIAALLLQFALPVVHQQHAEQSHAGPAASHELVAHDALGCPLCVAIAHGGANVLALAPTLHAPTVASPVVSAPAVRLLAAPARSGATPRGPPALA